MGSHIGTQKVAAKRIGIDFDEYLKKISSGMKWCTKCRQWKLVDDFNKDSYRGGGIASICKDCNYIRKMPGPAQRYRKINKKNGLSWCRGCKDWIPTELVKRGICKQHHNLEVKDKYRTDKKYRDRKRQYVHARKRRIDPIPFESQEQLTETFGGICAYCDNPAIGWDHLFPVIKGGDNSHFNIVPACASCNSSKHDKDLFNWLEEKNINISNELFNRMVLNHSFLL